MVKNTSGGTKTKGLARKHQGGAGGAGAGGGGGALRLPKNELEQLVVVTKMLGNGMCEAFNNDDVRFHSYWSSGMGKTCQKRRCFVRLRC